MKYADKLQGFIGRTGLFDYYSEENKPYITFALDTMPIVSPDDNARLVEVGDDYVVIQHLSNSRLQVCPLNLFMLFYNRDN